MRTMLVTLANPAAGSPNEGRTTLVETYVSCAAQSHEKHEPQMVIFVWSQAPRSRTIAPELKRWSRSLASHTDLGLPAGCGRAAARSVHDYQHHWRRSCGPILNSPRCASASKSRCTSTTAEVWAGRQKPRSGAFVFWWPGTSIASADGSSCAKATGRRSCALTWSPRTRLLEPGRDGPDCAVGQRRDRERPSSPARAECSRRCAV